MELPRVLVISSSFFNEKNNNGKTLSSFFFGYTKEKIAQISLNASTNDPSVCEQYYAITITDVLKGKSGRSFPANSSGKNTIYSDKGSLLKKTFHYYAEKRTPITTYIKNLIWKRCDRTGMYRFIESFKPDVVFFQGFSLCYGYDIALDICKKYKLPMVLELTDDYTARLFPLSVVDSYNHKKYNSYFEEAISYASSVIVISPKMRAEYEHRYGKKMVEMMNSVTVNPSLENNRDKHLFVYAGNVKLNRWKVLIEFSKAIYRIHPQNTLFICTPDSVSDKVLNEFSKYPNIVYGGSLRPSELKERFTQCTYAVHVESFDKKNREITRYSLSTKIPEYMSSGALIIAIGPEDIASMEYIKDERVGICINFQDAESMYMKLINIPFDDSEVRESYVDRALERCRASHSKEINSKAVQNLLISAANTKCV